MDRDSEFTKELEALLNRFSKENVSNTPDFILAAYIENCLIAWSVGIQQREAWYGRDPRPSEIGGEVIHTSDEGTSYCTQCEAYARERDSVLVTLAQDREAWQRKEAGLRAILSRHAEERDTWRPMAEKLAEAMYRISRLTQPIHRIEMVYCVETLALKAIQDYEAALKAGQPEKCKYSPPFINDHSQCQHQPDGGREGA